MASLFGLIFLFILYPFSFVIGNFVLKPLRDADFDPHWRTQFLITDIYSLLIQLALLGALLAPHIEFIIAFWLIFIWWWWMGVRMLSKAGVTSATRRAVTLIVGVPCAYGGPLTLLQAFLLIFVATRMGQSDPPPPPTLLEKLLPFVMLLFFGFILLLLVLGCRAIARWALGGSEKQSKHGAD